MINSEKERILLLLDAIISDCDVLSVDVSRSLNTKNRDKINFNVGIN